MRKIRDQRDKELEDTRFAGEEEMAQKRLDRDAEIADITKQEREQLEKVRTEKTKELEGVLEEQGGKNRKIIGFIFGLTKGLRFHFDSETCPNYPFFNIS